MFAKWQRRRLRAQFSPLINQELPAAEARTLRDAIAADPALEAEYVRLETALSAVRTLPEVVLPSHFAASLDAELDLVDQPLRARFSDLLDDALPADEAAALRAEIEAVPELAGEFAFLSKIVATCHELPTEPLPAGFANRLARSLDAIDAERGSSREPARPALAPRRNLAFAGLLAVVLGFGMLAGRHLPSRVGVSDQPVAVVPAPAPEPEPAAAVATPPTERVAEVTGDAPAGRPVARVERPQPESSPVAASTPSAPRARPVSTEPTRTRVRVHAEPKPPPTRAAPRVESQPTVTLGSGTRIATNVLNQPVATVDRGSDLPPRSSFVPKRPPPTPTITRPAPNESKRDRKPLTNVVLPPADPPTRFAAAPSREIPSPRLLNRYASSTVDLEFTTASLAPEPSLPRATLPDLEFVGAPD